jgi:hypothetical protein
LVAFAHINLSKGGSDLSHSENVVLDGSKANALTEDIVSKGQVYGKHGELELSALDGHVLHEVVVIVLMPAHYICVHEVVEPAGTNCPRVFGGFCTSSLELQYNAELILCSSSALGWKLM